MNFIENIKNRAKQEIKTIVLPEAEDLRTLKATQIALKEKYANIVLVGNEEIIKQKAQENNIPTIEDYIQKTYLKTGTLFEGTIKGVLEISTIKDSKLIDFAKNIGILFQINNDIKNLEKDITNGIYTLPIIFSNSINISKNSIEKTLSLIDNYTSNAIQALSCLGESEYKKSLIGVVECLKISEINITNLEKNTQI